MIIGTQNDERQKERIEKIFKESEVRDLENYAKVILYTYPFLKTVGKDYEEHIRNKALLSYRNQEQTEALAEYLAEEILRKESLERLKGIVEDILERLSDVERTLIAIRYFGKKRKIKKAPTGIAVKKESPKNLFRSERNYFRKQQRLSEKVGAMLRCAGITKEVYLKEFAPIDLFSKIQRFVAEGRDGKISEEEKRWLN